MNSVIILREELVSPHEARVTGARARYLYEIHQLRAGLTVRAAVLGGLRGKAAIESASAVEVRLTLELAEKPLLHSPVTLFCAVPRPQTVKKVLSTCAQFGVEALYLIKSHHVVKSYLQSKSLEERAIQEELIHGLEQVGDSRLPRVGIVSSFRDFLENILPGDPLLKSGSCHRFIMHTDADACTTLAGVKLQEQSSVCMGFGPERGWTEGELSAFLERGFRPCSLGSRMLRVDTAVTAALAQLELCRQITK